MVFEWERTFFTHAIGLFLDQLRECEPTILGRYDRVQFVHTRQSS